VEHIPLAAVVGVAVTFVLLAVCFGCGHGLANRLARRTLETQGRSKPVLLAWRTSCVFASLFASSLVLFALALLVAATLWKTGLSVGGVGVISAVAVGVVGNHIDRQITSGWSFYWSQIHGSIRAVVSEANRRGKVPACQRTLLMNTHRELMHWDTANRKAALAGILKAQVCTDRRVCPGHVLPSPEQGKARPRRLSAALIVIAESPILAVLIAGWLVITLVVVVAGMLAFALATVAGQRV
jgi:hypothetical protein